MRIWTARELTIRRQDKVAKDLKKVSIWQTITFGKNWDNELCTRPSDSKEDGIIRICFSSLRILRGKPLLEGVSRIFHHGRTTEQSKTKLLNYFGYWRVTLWIKQCIKRKYCNGKACDLYTDMEDTSAWSSYWFTKIITSLHHQDE